MRFESVCRMCSKAWPSRNSCTVRHLIQKILPHCPLVHLLVHPCITLVFLHDLRIIRNFSSLSNYHRSSNFRIMNSTNFRIIRYCHRSTNFTTIKNYHRLSNFIQGRMMNSLLSNSLRLTQKEKIRLFLTPEFVLKLMVLLKLLDLWQHLMIQKPVELCQFLTLGHQ